MGETPLNPGARQRTVLLPPQPSKLWQTLLNALLTDRPLRIEREGKAIEVTRAVETNDEGNRAVIWTKKYGRDEDSDLSIFNETELSLLLKADHEKLPHRYRLAHLSVVGSPLHTGRTPAHLRKGRTTVLKTYDEGPDLHSWARMRVFLDGKLLRHPFVPQQNFLRLTREIFVALQAFHEARFVHCDLHLGNIVMAASTSTVFPMNREDAEFFVKPLWNRVKLIDFGYSVHKGIEPMAMLPLAPWADEARQVPMPGMSPRLQQVLADLVGFVEASGWPPAEQYLRRRWVKEQHRLAPLIRLDWRDDLAPLGHKLRLLRDGKGHSEWGGVERVGRFPEVNAFIDRFPEELERWGHADLPGDGLLPHASYIAQIDELLRLLPEPSEAFVLRRADHDAAYKEFIAPKPTPAPTPSPTPMPSPAPAPQPRRPLPVMTILVGMTALLVAGTAGTLLTQKPDPAPPPTHPDKPPPPAASQDSLPGAIAKLHQASPGSSNWQEALKVAARLAQDPRTGKNDANGFWRALDQQYARHTEAVIARSTQPTWWDADASKKLAPGTAETAWLETTKSLSEQGLWAPSVYLAAAVYSQREGVVSGALARDKAFTDLTAALRHPVPGPEGAQDPAVLERHREGMLDLLFVTSWREASQAHRSSQAVNPNRAELLLPLLKDRSRRQPTVKSNMTLALAFACLPVPPRFDDAITSAKAAVKGAQAESNAALAAELRGKLERLERKEIPCK